MSFFRNFRNQVTNETTWSGRILLILMVIVILIIAIILSGPKPQTAVKFISPPTNSPVAAQATSSLIPQPTLKPTSIPSSEYAGTTGVIVAVITVVVIVILGSVIEMVRYRKIRQ